MGASIVAVCVALHYMYDMMEYITAVFLFISARMANNVIQVNKQTIQHSLKISSWTPGYHR